nr:M56 family metallopeptidase [Planctomycetota bacterium]
MNAITWLSSVAESEICVRLTLALLHFLWLGTVIAVSVAIASWCLNHRSARLRYTVNLSALGAMAICLPVAWLLVDLPRASPLGEHSQPAGRVLAATGSSNRSTLADSQFVSASKLTSQSGIGSLPPDARPGFAENGNEPGAEAEPFLAAAPAVAAETPGALATQTTEGHPQNAASWRSLAHWAPLATGLYVAGVVVMLLRLLVSIHGGRRLRAAAEPLNDAQILRQSHSLARQLGLRLTPPVAFCARVSVPVAAGILRPMILLPGSLATGLTAKQFEAILLHEMAHIRRHDLIFNLLQRVVESLLFFHPGVWYVSRRVSIERENCCDDVVVASGWKQTDYAAALISMAEACLLGESSNRRLPISTVAASGGGSERSSEFKRRIQRLLGAGEPPRLNVSGPMLALLAMLSVAGVLVSAAPPAPPVQSDEGRTKTAPDTGNERPAAKQDGKEAKQDADGELLSLIDEAISLSRRRGLSAEVHTPWQIMQGLLAFGSDHQLLVEGELVPLTTHLAAAPQFRGEFWFERTKSGGRAHPYSKPFLFEGHPDQFAAWLAVAGVSQDTKIGVADGHITVGDLVRHAQSRASLETHQPWTLMLLAFSSPQGGEWQDAGGQKQRLEEFVEVALESLSQESSPALKSATLFALAKARSRRPVDLAESTLWKIDREITESTIRAFHGQDDQGAIPFTTRQKANGAPPKLRDRIGDTGSTLAWISRGATRSLATSDQAKKAARFLAQALIDQSRKPLSTTALFQCVHGLAEFRTRMNRYRVFGPKLRVDDPDVLSAKYLLQNFLVDPLTGKPRDDRPSAGTGPHI